MAFDLKDAITIEKKKYDGRHEYTYTGVFHCKTEGCKNLCRVQTHHLKKAKGFCKICVQRGPPFLARYNELVKNAKRRNYQLTLTFEEFLEFTKINQCHYCASIIEWRPFTRDENDRSQLSRKYQLDRKDNELGYTLQNCVVCCTRCNYSKNARYTYEEWFGMNEYFRKKI